MHRGVFVFHICFHTLKAFSCKYHKITIENFKVLNPLDAICDRPREDAICVNQLRDAGKKTAADPELLQGKPDVKIFLPFRFYLYRPEELFQPNTYNRYLGKFIVNKIFNKKWTLFF